MAVGGGDAAAYAETARAGSGGVTRASFSFSFIPGSAGAVSASGFGRLIADKLTVGWAAPGGASARPEEEPRKNLRSQETST